jgi:hypothetical protein
MTVNSKLYRDAEFCTAALIKAALEQKCGEAALAHIPIQHDGTRHYMRVTAHGCTHIIAIEVEGPIL